MTQETKQKLIVILGPTASGKTDLSIKLAKKFNGEVVSADSRQVYKGMDIGTGKVTKTEMQGVPHYLLDVASPRKKFTVVQYKKFAQKAIEKILKKGKIPILCGGTGFYIQAVIDNLSFPPVKPDWKLRKKLEAKSAQELFNALNKKDPERAKSIDKNNKRRLIRALEIVITSKKPVPSLEKDKSLFDVLIIGIKINFEKLKKLIKKRLLKRFKIGMVKEVEKLKKSGLSWKRLEEFGLEYRYIAQYLQGKSTKKEMIEKLEKEIEHFAKRQMTWFKKDKRIQWIKNFKEAEKLVKKFLQR
jgi:tRNA dimethylallyltransferase